MTEPAHILVIDDDPNTRRMLQLVFHEAGYRVSTVNNGEEALAFLELVNPDLILSDLMLPDISGQEITARIKSDPKRPFIPIILVTARNDRESKVAALDAGADDFVVKPVDFAELQARARVALRLQRSQRQLQAEQRKTELLLHLSRKLNSSLDLDHILISFLEQLADSVGALRANVILTTDDQPRFYSTNRRQPSMPLVVLLHDGVAGWVMREGKSAMIADIRLDSRWKASPDTEGLASSVLAVPIIREGRSLGAITLVHHTIGYFTEEHLDLLESIAAQSGIALENAELFRLTRKQNNLLERRNQEMERINQVSQHLSELMRPDQLLRLVAYLTHHTFNYPLVSILIHDGEDLVVRALAGTIETEFSLGMRLAPEKSIAGWVAAHREPLNVPSVWLDERFSNVSLQSAIASELAVPILTMREVYGVLMVSSDHEAAFDQNDIRLLSTLAGQLGIALDNARLFDGEKRRARQLGEVNSLSVAITAQLDPQENVRIATDAVATIFGLERCAVVVHGSVPHTDNLQQVESPAVGARLGLGPTALRLTELLSLRDAEVIYSVFDDPRLASLLADLSRDAIESLALAPLVAREQQLGMIVLDISGQAERFAQNEQTLLVTVASLIAQSIENGQLYRQAEEERSTLNAVLDGAADPILLISPQDEVLLANRAAGEYLGITEAMGQPLEALVTTPGLRNALESRANGNGTPQALPEVLLPEGDTFSVSVAPVRGAGATWLGRVAVLQNITAIKELERREQERLRSVFARYMASQVVEQVMAGGGDIGAPEERDIVVIFADLRGYTTLTEGLEPRVLVDQVLNRYFTAVTNVLYRYEGTVDKFMGDGLIGVFGTPIVRDNDVERSLLAAVDIQRAFDELRQVWRAELGLDIGLGIGIGYGRAIVGNIGSAQRVDYTVIGDVVNTANRLSSLAAGSQIIISYHLVEALKSDTKLPWRLRPLDRVLLKGKQEPHLIYEVDY